MATAFDEAELLDRVDNDVSFLAETVQMLETDGQSLVVEIRKAVEAADPPAVGRAAHALKGMISNFCSPRTQECALELERLGKAGDLSAAPAALEQLNERLGALIAELRQFVQARS